MYKVVLLIIYYNLYYYCLYNNNYILTIEPNESKPGKVQSQLHPEVRSRLQTLSSSRLMNCLLSLQSGTAA